MRCYSFCFFSVVLGLCAEVAVAEEPASTGTVAGTSLPAEAVTPTPATNSVESENDESAEAIGEVGSVAFSVRVGRSDSQLPAAPGKGSAVSQALYQVSLGLAFPLSDLYPSLLTSGTFDALYPTSVSNQSGGVSSVLRAKVGFGSAIHFADGMRLAGDFGYAVARMHYGLAVVSIWTPRASAEIASSLPWASFYDLVPVVVLAGGYEGGVGRYSTNRDETPLLVDSNNVAISTASFKSSGKFSSWDVTISPQIAFRTGPTYSRVSLFWTLRREYLPDMKVVTGLGKKVRSGEPSYSVLGLGLERAL